MELDSHQLAPWEACSWVRPHQKAGSDVGSNIKPHPPPPPPPIFTGGTADSRLITGGGLAHLVPTVMQIVLLYRSLGDHTDAQVREVRVVYRCCV